MEEIEPTGIGEQAGTDWPALRKRQQAANAAALEERSLSPEAARGVLKARAALLAQRPAQDADQGVRLDCLEFLLSGERHAMEMSFISQTLPLSDFTPLFCTPPFVLGITNLRGRIVPIVDLRRFFELPALGLGDLNRVVVVSNGSMEV